MIRSDPGHCATVSHDFILPVKEHDLMRIAMISTPFLPTPPRQYGGTELVIHELTEGLVRRGHEVTLFATGDSTTSAELRFLYETAQWPPVQLTDFNHVTWALQSIIAQGNYDVVHAHSAAALAVQRLATSLPLVYTLHHERDAQLSDFYRWFPHAHFVAISDDQRRREIHLPHLDVIHHGLDPAKYEATRSPDDYVCCVGRLSYIKGVHTAIDCAAAAGVPIRVGGDVHEPDREWADEELSRRLEQTHVAYLGPIGLDVKASLLRKARALLMPIEWNEPFGLIMIEAMLSGCPVVAFERGSVAEVVDEGETGFVATSATHMAELIRPGGPVDTFDRLACRAHAIERWGRDRMVRDHERVYRRLVDRTSTPSPNDHLRVA
jgi:glycosyltransferase involved in cell wall biosynthesis